MCTEQLHFVPENSSRVWGRLSEVTAKAKLGSSVEQIPLNKFHDRDCRRAREGQPRFVSDLHEQVFGKSLRILCGPRFLSYPPAKIGACSKAVRVRNRRVMRVSRRPGLKARLVGKLEPRRWARRFGLRFVCLLFGQMDGRCTTCGWACGSWRGCIGKSMQREHC